MADVTTRSVVLRAEDVHIQFKASRKLLGRAQAVVRAVDGVDLTVERGTIIGIVGESGCGKSTLARGLIGLRKLHQGAVHLDDLNIAKMDRAAERKMRRRMQIIFQDPYASLNPRFSVRQTLAEPIKEHRLRTKQAAIDARVHELLQLVGMRPSAADRYPHEFSGGQRQRIAIARALAVEPEILVCDEPISALDVSIQAQILNLLSSLRDELSLTYIFVAHDLAVVRRFCTHVAVMYLGKIVEEGERDDVYGNPQHPYTVALLAAAPKLRKEPDQRRQRAPLIEGDLPSPTTKFAGCPFVTRCWLYQKLGEPENCRTISPGLTGQTGSHRQACHHADRVREYAPEVS